MRKSYSVDLSALQQLAERNYAAMLGLLPATLNVGDGQQIHVGEQLSYQLQVTDSARFTTDVKIRQVKPEAGWLSATIEVRLYHDVRMAEVIGNQGIRRLQARYQQPNPAMHQADEKHQVNRFLRDWLTLCQRMGRSNVALAFN
ncbi:DUF1249 domain-containing protein [Idiomarina xiamenensis]|uniref:Dehydrogenase n=1 Tax=Idiomarina xiamenensis 10-D-4 TaxID=740709 RepID=K2L1M8_9GAMM|nr:DUF1249 domain-containing protein [Idiomarina xiamenensis]EKE83695.1 hypothetical protein A10D4_07600 [Idiomarina xiamenensis 10-D-4]